MNNFISIQSFQVKWNAAGEQFLFCRLYKIDFYPHQKPTEKWIALYQLPILPVRVQERSRVLLNTGTMGLYKSVCTWENYSGNRLASIRLVGLLGLCFWVKSVLRWCLDSNNSTAYVLWKALLMAKMWKWEPELPSSFRELSMRKVLCQTSPSWQKLKLLFLSVNTSGLGLGCLQHYN